MNYEKGMLVMQMNKLHKVAHICPSFILFFFLICFLRIDPKQLIDLLHLLIFPFLSRTVSHAFIPYLCHCHVHSLNLFRLFLDSFHVHIRYRYFTYQFHQWCINDWDNTTKLMSGCVIHILTLSQLSISSLCYYFSHNVLQIKINK